jgi:CDP-diacylglycerol--serine O-phosphatidyltransferase
MVFDMLDGRVARLTKQTSDFGGQLDSLSDAVTFGIAPGVLVAMMNAKERFPDHQFWAKTAWVFGAAYACGAILRLARFNVENEHGEESHLSFKGLPSPGAAGVIATLTLFQSYLATERAERNFGWVEHDFLSQVSTGLGIALPFVALFCGYLMISQHRYVHVPNRFLRGRKPFDMLALILFSGVLLALVPELIGAVAFGGFALSGPINSLLRWRGILPDPTAQPQTGGSPPEPGAPPSTPATQG